MKWSRKQKAILAIVGLGAAVTLGPSAVTAQVTTSGSGAYYATPSWDQKITSGSFVVLTNWNNEAVLDRETGLVWEKTPDPSTFTLGVAFHCLDKNTGGRTGWRVPGIPELMSLLDRSQPSPMLPAGHPFTVQPSFYWSATLAGEPGYAWAVSFGSGVVVGFNKNNFDHHVWCVRGGAGVDTL